MAKLCPGSAAPGVIVMTAKSRRTIPRRSSISRKQGRAPTGARSAIAARTSRPTWTTKSRRPATPTKKRSSTAGNCRPRHPLTPSGKPSDRSGRSAKEALWPGAPTHEEIPGRSELGQLPSQVARYLDHAIAPHSPAATAVRLRMKGRILLGTWRDFEAEEILHSNRGFVWAARTRLFGLPVSGFDRLLDGAGTMRWSVLGVLPFLRSQGENVSRSAAGRFAGEHCWLPSALLNREIAWTVEDDGWIGMKLPTPVEIVAVRLRTDQHGALQAIIVNRWGSLARDTFGYYPFVVRFSAERTFESFSVPTELTAGWEMSLESPGSASFEATITEAEYR